MRLVARVQIQTIAAPHERHRLRGAYGGIGKVDGGRGLVSELGRLALEVAPTALGGAPVVEGAWQNAPTSRSEHPNTSTG
ncbi:MAG TPA: hypothetical protein VNO21_12660 [Polyangiaceae bacterium]|nr:hypothetical protein [Polyangiaceae bacterium]